MKTSEILRRTKKELSKKTLQGVCLALWKTSGVPYSSLCRVQTMINARIGGSIYATVWLAQQVLFGNKRRLPKDWYITRNQWLRDQKDKDIQAWRHRWVDSMIAEFKSNGD